MKLLILILLSLLTLGLTSCSNTAGSNPKFGVKLKTEFGDININRDDNGTQINLVSDLDFPTSGNPQK